MKNPELIKNLVVLSYTENAKKGVLTMTRLSGGTALSLKDWKGLLTDKFERYELKNSNQDDN